MAHFAFLIPSVAVAAVIVAALVLLKLKISAQEDRIHMAKAGVAALTRKDLTPEARRYVEFWLDHAFGARGFMLAVVIIMPFALVVRAIKPSLWPATSIRSEEMSQRTRELVGDVDRLSTRLLFANNPILLVVALVEITICMAIITPVTHVCVTVSRALGATGASVVEIHGRQGLVASAVVELDEIAHRFPRSGHAHAHAA